MANRNRNSPELFNQNILDRNSLENWFLSKLLLDNNFAKIIDKEFDNRWLKNKENITVAKLLINFAKKYDRKLSVNEFKTILNSVIKKDKTKLSDDYVKSLIYNLEDVVKNISTDILTDTVSDFVKKQAAWCAIIDSVDGIEKNPESTVTSCLNRLNDVITLELSNPDVGFDYFDIDEYNDYFDFILNPQNKISTGWNSIDNITHGGFLTEGKSLYIVIGQPGLGKSVFLSNFAVNFLKQNKTIAVISLEMSEYLYAQRFDAHISQININELNQNESNVKNRIANFKNLYPDARLFIKEYAPRSINTSHIERYLNELVNVKGIKLDAIIIDYLNLVLPSYNVGDNMYLGGLDVSEKLRALSYKFEVPVITACQVNTLGMNSEDVDMAHISESRGIAHTGDYIQALFQTEENRADGVISVKVLKNRLGGRVGSVFPFRLDPETLVLTDASGVISSNNQATNIQKVNNLLSGDAANEDLDNLMVDIMDL